MVIFEVESIKKRIRLAEVQWKHITKRHPEMARRLHDIEQAIKFYKFIKSEKRYNTKKIQRI